MPWGPSLMIFGSIWTHLCLTCLLLYGWIFMRFCLARYFLWTFWLWLGLTMTFSWTVWNQRWFGYFWVLLKFGARVRLSFLANFLVALPGWYLIILGFLRADEFQWLGSWWRFCRTGDLLRGLSWPDGWCLLTSPCWPDLFFTFFLLFGLFATGFDFPDCWVAHRWFFLWLICVCVCKDFLFDWFVIWGFGEIYVLCESNASHLVWRWLISFTNWNCRWIGSFWVLLNFGYKGKFRFSWKFFYQFFLFSFGQIFFTFLCLYYFIFL